MQNSFQIEKYNRIIIYSNAFLIGLIIMAMEMAGSRFLTPFFGNSVFTWASIISMVLLSLAIGYFFGGYLAEKKQKTDIIAYLIYAAAIFILLIPVYYEELFRWIYKNIPNINLGGFLGALLTLFLPLSLLGTYSPFSVKLGTSNSNKSGKISGSLYAVATLGSILGTLGVTFLLIPFIGSKSIVFTLSILTFLSALSIFSLKVNVPSLDKLSKGKMKLVLLILVYSILFLATAIFSESLSKNNKNKYLLEKVDSSYNNILVIQKGDYLSMSFRQFTSKYTESKKNTKNELELPLPYSRIMQLGLLYSAQKDNLLMIGLGAGSITTHLSKYLPDMKITGVELDEKVIYLAKKYFGLKENSNYKIIIEDGRIFLSKNNIVYNLIMIDAYKGGNIPFHLCTQEFYKNVGEHLSKNGCVVLNLHSGSKLYNHLYATLLSVFENVDLYSFPDNSNVVAFAYMGAKKSHVNLRYKAKILQSKHDFYYDMTDLVDLNIKPPILNKSKILTDDFAPINYLNAIEEHNRN